MERKIEYGNIPNALWLTAKLGYSHLRASYLGVEKVCVHHSAFDVVQICVVFQRPLQETSLLTQLCHMGAIVVGEHLVAQDGVCNLHDVKRERKWFQHETADQYEIN